MDNRKLCKANTEGYNMFREDDNPELLELEFRRKEIIVKKLHKNKISSPVGTCKSYRTRLNGERISTKTYKEMIELLFNYYYDGMLEVPTFKECAYAWAEERLNKKIVSYNTYEHYINDFKKYVEPLDIANKVIDKISKKELYAMFEGIVGLNEGLKKQTLGNIKTVVNGAFNYANMQDGIDVIDADKIKITDLKRKCEDVKESECYTREEIEKLLKHIESKKQTVYTLAIRLDCCLPVRIGELRAITWDDYLEDDGLLMLQHQIVCQKEGNVHRKAVDVDYMKSHSKMGKRYEELSDYAVLVLEELKKINGNKKYILQSKGEMPISTNNYNEHLRKYCNECGIEYKSSHKIRFYACSEMYDNNIDERTIQNKMGHSTIAMTRYYDRRKRKNLDKSKVNTVFGYEIPKNTHFNQNEKPRKHSV